MLKLKNSIHSPLLIFVLFKLQAENRGLPGLSDVEFGHLPRDLQLRLKVTISYLFEIS